MIQSFMLSKWASIQHVSSTPEDQQCETLRHVFFFILDYYFILFLKYILCIEHSKDFTDLKQF